ncbi:MAG: hypothetical protein P8Y70_01380 [Candidatus Lokiarchaeota archaeon]
MCNNCNCENYDRCSIVGYMPIGFCCSKCDLYDESHTCLHTKTKRKDSEKVITEEIHPISTKIEGGLLKVVIDQKGKKIPIVIDIQKQLESR